MIDQFVQEEIDVIIRHGAERCLKRTSNGAPWAMPCCLHKDHDESQQCIPDTDVKFFIRKVI